MFWALVRISEDSHTDSERLEKTWGETKEWKMKAGKTNIFEDLINNHGRRNQEEGSRKKPVLLLRDHGQISWNWPRQQSKCYLRFHSCQQIQWPRFCWLCVRRLLCLLLKKQEERQRHRACLSGVKKETKEF